LIPQRPYRDNASGDDEPTSRRTAQIRVPLAGQASRLILKMEVPMSQNLNADFLGKPQLVGLMPPTELVLRLRNVAPERLRE
jgi:hypothetical protein